MTIDRMRGSLELLDAEVGAADPGGVVPLRLHTNAGTIRCRYYESAPGDAAVLWVFGAGGGLGGPAGGVYARLGAQLAPEGIASLELDYRRPAELTNCVLDVLLGVGYLGTRGRPKVVLVGHSFGGAVAIAAAAATNAVIGVAALSSQTQGTGAAPAVSPRPLLVVHGTADEVLPDRCAHDIYARAREPKELKLYPGCRHGLDQCREALDRDLLEWVRRVVAA